jgi:hypothetical protein
LFIDVKLNGWNMILEKYQGHIAALPYQHIEMNCPAAPQKPAGSSTGCGELNPERI